MNTKYIELLKLLLFIVNIYNAFGWVRRLAWFGVDEKGDKREKILGGIHNDPIFQQKPFRF